MSDMDYNALADELRHKSQFENDMDFSDAADVIDQLRARVAELETMLAMEKKDSDGAIKMREKHISELETANAELFGVICNAHEWLARAACIEERPEHDFARGLLKRHIDPMGPKSEGK